MRRGIHPTLHCYLRSICVAACLLAGSAQSARALGSFNIQLNPGSQLAANPDALAAFQRAADEWKTRISSSITIHIDADLRSTGFGPNVIGETSYDFYTTDLSDINLPFDAVRTALIAHASRPNDAMLASLPTSAQVTAEVPTGAAFLNDSIGVLRANQRALGLLAESDTRADGSILFNSNFTFDYNRFDADGVAAGKVDFQTAAAHEIGHLLGFQSDVDDFDNGATEDNLTTLDLFRFPTSHIPATASDFQFFARELRPGVESVLTDLSAQYPLSTGQNLGDGNQASHWKDDFLVQTGTTTIGPLIGIMDPTLADGTSEDVGDADFRAMDLIGYNVGPAPVPEPSAAALFFSAIAACLLMRKFRVTRI